MAQSVKVAENAYIVTDKKQLLGQLDEFYSYMLTKYLESIKAGMTLSDLYSTISSYLKEDFNYHDEDHWFLEDDEKEKEFQKAYTFESKSYVAYSDEDIFYLQYPELDSSFHMTSIEKRKVAILSESNKSAMKGISDVDGILLMPATDFQNVKHFFFSKVLFADLSKFKGYRATVNWKHQLVTSKSDEERVFAFVVYVDSEKANSALERVSRIKELSNFVRREMPDALNSTPSAYIKRIMFNGMRRDNLYSDFDSDEFAKMESFDHLDWVGQRYLQLRLNSEFGLKGRLGCHRTEELLGSKMGEYIELCKKAGIKPSEFMSLRGQRYPDEDDLND